MACITCKRMFSGRVAVLASTDSLTRCNTPSFPAEPAIWLIRSSAVGADSLSVEVSDSGPVSSIPAGVPGVVDSTAGSPAGAPWTDGTGADGCSIGAASAGATRGCTDATACSSSGKSRVVLPGFTPSVSHDVDVVRLDDTGCSTG